MINHRLRSALFICLTLFSFAGVFGQNGTQTSEEKPIAMGINVGVKALIGVDLAYEYRPDLYIKGGFNYMDFRVRDFETNLGFLTHTLSIDGDMRFSSFEIMAEKRVWNDKMGVVAGLAYFPVNHYRGKILLRDSVQFAGQWWYPDELGYIGGIFTYRTKFSPYLGITLGKPIPKNKRWGFNANIGAYYKGAVDILIEGSNLLEHNGRNDEIIEGHLNSWRFIEWRFMPNISFRLSYILNYKEPPTEPISVIPDN